MATPATIEVLTYTCPHIVDCRHEVTAADELEAWTSILEHHTSEHGWCTGFMDKRDFRPVPGEAPWPKKEAKRILTRTG